jgi:hypothetical protein
MAIAWVKDAFVGEEAVLKAILKLSTVKYALPERSFALNLTLTSEEFVADAMMDFMSAE